MAVLAAAGIEVVGENRLQDLIAKHGRFADVFRWHFIGHLQSRKARDVSRLCELVHSLDSVSAAQRLTVPALVEVNLSGEETKSGVPRAALGSFLSQARELGVDVRGLMTMPPLARDPEAFFAAELRAVPELAGAALGPRFRGRASSFCPTFARTFFASFAEMNFATLSGVADFRASIVKPASASASAVFFDRPRLRSASIVSMRAILIPP